MSAHPPYSAKQFFAELFDSQAARNGEIVRRKVRDVERYVGRDTFVAEMRRRGFRSSRTRGSS